MAQMHRFPDEITKRAHRTEQQRADNRMHHAGICYTRPGYHRRMRTTAGAGVILVASLAVSASAHAKTATAERFDASIRVQPEGTLDVSETRFAPTSASTHTFRIRYVVRGAVRQDERGDLLVWRIPGGAHPWRVKLERP